MSTASVLVFYSCYFLLTALFLAILYQRRRHDFTRSHWLLLTGAVLIGALSPGFISYLGVGLAFVVFMLFTISLAWLAWRQTAPAAEEGIFSHPLPDFTVLETPQQNAAIKKEEQAEMDGGYAEDEREPAAGGFAIDAEEEKEMLHELLAFDEAAAGKEDSGLRADRVPQADLGLDELRSRAYTVGECEDSEYSNEEHSVPAFPSSDPARELGIEEEEDEILYFFDEEPSHPAAKKKSVPRESLPLDNDEWNLIQDEKSGMDSR